MISKPRSISLIFFVAAITLTLDQISKNWVIDHIAVGGAWSPFPAIGRYFRIIHTGNTGVAFGMFQGYGNLFTFVAAAAVIAIIVYAFTQTDTTWLASISFGLMLGGAAGNLWNRLTYGHVIDFIDVRYSDSLVWPTFNIADSSLIVGVILLTIGLWVAERQPPPSPGVPLEQGEPLS
ncbi:MAG: signal peptidase II [Chloroflexi bacterium]|nr:signal peptidase II [Chloroflexota bacterium]